jgi:hypothetical protein
MHQNDNKNRGNDKINNNFIKKVEKNRNNKEDKESIGDDKSNGKQIWRWQRVSLSIIGSIFYRYLTTYLDACFAFSVTIEIRSHA